jgi:pimeloyl-ACP methyl ester carboxylesterase
MTANASSSAQFRTSDGVELRYLEAGSGPTLVFVPGWTMPAEIWEHQLRHFASTHRVLGTPTNAAAIMIANLILMGPTDLRPALDALDRPAIFIASSLNWAVEQAEKVREGWPDIHVEVIEGTSHALL